MALRAPLLALVLACFACSALARRGLTAAAAKATYPTFFDALAADTANHKLLANAIGSDAATKALMKTQLNVTAFVPTDTAFVKALVKYKLPFTPAKMANNSCLVNAILRYHIMAPSMTLGRLKTAGTKNTLLLTSVAGSSQKAAKTLRFKTEGSNVRVVAAASNGLLVAPKDVVAGRGILQTIDTVLLPTTNVTALAEMTGCKIYL